MGLNDGSYKVTDVGTQTMGLNDGEKTMGLNDGPLEGTDVGTQRMGRNDGSLEGTDV